MLFINKSSCLNTLRVVLVRNLAGARRAAAGTRPVLATTLSVQSSTCTTTTTASVATAVVAATAVVTATSGAAAARVHGRSREWEGLVAVVDVEIGIAVTGLVGSRKLDEGTRCAGAPALNLDLDARDIVLGLVDVRAVYANVLEADEVLAVRDVPRNVGCQVVLIVRAPSIGGEVGSVAADAFLFDLEPVARAVVGLDVIIGSARHVDKTGTRVLHRGTNTKSDLDLVSSIDRQNLGVARLGGGTLIAADVGAIGGRAITNVGRRVRRELDGVVLGGTSEVTYVLERTGRGALVGDDVKEVVCRSTLDSQHGAENGGDLHGGSEEQGNCLQ